MIAGTVKAGSRVQFSGQDLVSPRYCAGHQGWVELCKHCGAQGRPAGCHRLYTGRPYCAPSREQVGHNAVAQRCHKTLALPWYTHHSSHLLYSQRQDRTMGPIHEIAFGLPSADFGSIWSSQMSLVLQARCLRWSISRTGVGYTDAWNLLRSITTLTM